MKLPILMCVLVVLLVVDSVSARSAFRRLRRSSSSTSASESSSRTSFFSISGDDKFNEKEAKEIADKVQKAFASDPKVKEGTMVFDEKGTTTGKKEPEATAGKLSLPLVKPKQTVGIMLKDIEAKHIEAIANWLKTNKGSRVVVVAGKADEKVVDDAMKKEKVDEDDGTVWVFDDKGKKIFGGKEKGKKSEGSGPIGSGSKLF